MQKQKVKIANAMKIFDELAQSKLEVEKENKYMISEIKYWRDKFRDLEKGTGRDKEKQEQQGKSTSKQGHQEPINRS